MAWLVWSVTRVCWHPDDTVRLPTQSTSNVHHYYIYKISLTKPVVLLCGNKNILKLCRPLELSKCSQFPGEVDNGPSANGKWCQSGHLFCLYTLYIMANGVVCNPFFCVIVQFLNILNSWNTQLTNSELK